MRRIVVVGGGYAGFHTAWKLERKLKPGEAEITVVDPRPYLTYQPFLPEVAARSVEARHAAVSLRRHLRRTTVIAGMVTRIDHADKTVTIDPADGPDLDLGYDIIAVTAGAVTRNIAATLRGAEPTSYLHDNFGVVATLGLGRGVFQSGPVVITGFPAWVMHRGYHVLAVPSWERKVRVLGSWASALFFGRDVVSLQSVQHPREAFVSGGVPDAR